MSGAVPEDLLSVAEARALLPQARRIAVIGVSGAGKSTLSVEIARRHGLPHISHDRDIRWLPGWQMRDRREIRRMEEAFAAGESWIMDGTAVSTLAVQLDRADLCLWLRPPGWLALWQLAGRVRRYYGTVRPDMAEGCPEPIPDWAFLRYIWTYEARQSPRILALLNTHPRRVPTAVLSGRRDIRALLGRGRGRD